VGRRKLDKPSTVDVRESVRNQEDRVWPALCHRGECGREVLGIAHAQPLHLHTEGERRFLDLAVTQFGSASLRSSIRLALSWMDSSLNPVMFAPGRARVAIHPTATASPRRAP
jgi:hypothetical protein